MIIPYLFIGVVTYGILATYRWDDVKLASRPSFLMGYISTIFMWPIAIALNFYYHYSSKQ